MFRAWIAAAVIVSVFSSCSPSVNDALQDLNAELAAIMATLPGTYASEAPIPVPPNGELQTIYHTFAPIEAPQLGETLLYYQLSRGSADAPASQMKIFSFETDPSRTVNSMRAFVFYPDQAPGNLHKEPDRWASLDPATFMTFPSECDLTWSSVDKVFIGEVRPEDCGYPSETFKHTIRPAMTYRISGDRLEWAETLHRGDMTVMFTTGGTLPAVRQ